MKKRKMMACLLTAVLLAGCSSPASSSSAQSTETVYRNTSTADIFDTVYSYQEAPETDASKQHFDDTVKDLTEYNNLFDIYNNYDGLNNLKMVNDQAGIAPVKVDQKIIDMLKLARQFYDYSNGEFDITMGAVLNIWHTYRENGITLNNENKPAPVPSQEELQAVSQYRGWDKVIIDDDNDTVFITDPNVSLDVGGIAKGYAAEMVAQDIEKEGASGGYVNVGRNIRTTGQKIDGSDWVIGVADPEGKMQNGLVAVKEPGEISVVTSGDYERYYIGEDGNRYSHIVDPETLYPATLYHSVTIVTKDSGAADCLSTTLFTLDVEDGKKVLQEYEKNTGNKAEAIWVMDKDKTQNEEGKEVSDYFITYSDSLEDSLVWMNN